MGKPVLAILLLLAGGPAFADARYPAPAEVESSLRAAAASMPGAVLTEIGKSREGRPILALLAGLPGAVPLAERPRLLVVAGLAADHRIGTAAALGLPAALLALAGTDAALAETLSRTALEVVPLVNPDGLAALLAGPEREFRRNLAPLDEDRDGRVDEDGPQDLDGDGRITTMRIPDAAGPWRVSPEDPRLLLRADLDRFERGAFRLLTEGLDADGDGEIAEDGPGGVDLDRNFPHGGDRYDLLRGASQPGEPETRALADHLLATPRIAAVLVYGHYDTLSGAPAQNRAQGRAIPDGPLPEDMPLFTEASRRFRAATGHEGDTGDPPAGAFHQWVYYDRGIPAFATPLWFPPTGDDLVLPSGAKAVSAEARWLAWSDRELAGAGFTPWKSFTHPTLGDVEIGGFAPLLTVNPPPDRIPDIVLGQAKFAGDLLALLPRPALADVRARALGEGAFEVTATLVNDGTFPFATTMGERSRALEPLRVLLLPPAAIVAGEPRTLVLRPPGGTRTFRWIVAGRAGDRVRVRVECARFPAVETEVTL